MASEKPKHGILFTADMHLRDDVPVCRTDDFMTEQWRKLRQIAELVKSRNLYWVDCGDIFHKARPSYRLVNNLTERLHYWQVAIDYAITGNHDMPGHNSQAVNMEDTAWYNLLSSGKIKNWAYGGNGLPLPCNFGNVVVYGANYGKKLEDELPHMRHDDEDENINICILHDMVFKDKNHVNPNVGDYWLASQLPFTMGLGYSYFVCGHNHQSWKFANVYNVGCLTRQTADMTDHIPSVVILTKDGMERVTLAHKENVVSRAHIDKEQANEEQISSFVQSLENNQEVSLSFERNVQVIINTTKPVKSVEVKIREAME